MGIQRGLWPSNKRNRFDSILEVGCHIGRGFVWGEMVPTNSTGGFVIAAASRPKTKP